jgi:putative ABC transport system permease protein
MAMPGGRLQDIRLALRSLRTTPLVTAAAVLSLALGIGANTAIFSLVDSLILRPLAVADPQRLAIVSAGTAHPDRSNFNYAALEQIRTRVTAFDDAVAYSNCCGKATVRIGGVPQVVDRFFVTGNFFSTLGVSALLGRLFEPADDAPAGHPNGPTAVVSYRFWRDSLGGGVAAVGAPIDIDGVSVTVVGVVPPDFIGIEVGRPFDVALPVKTQPLIFPTTAFPDDAIWLNIMVRLRRGTSIADGAAALRAAQPAIRNASLPREFPAEYLKDPFVLQPAGAGTSTLRERFERPLLAVLVVVAVVLLIASANIANLLLARSAARRHEFSVRLALGASRWRLARQLLAESGLLAGSGAISGIVCGRWATGLLVSQLSTSTTPVVLNLALDWRVLAFTIATTVATAIAFGILPAVRATRTTPMRVLREHGGTAAPDRGFAGGWSRGLIVGQVALSLLLVTATGLFMRSFARLAEAPLGLDRDRSLLITLTAPTVGGNDRNAFYHRLVKAAAAVPGVASAGGSLNPPIAGTLIGDVVVSDPGVMPRGDAEVVSQYTDVTPGALAAYGTSIRAGRDFDDHDSGSAPGVMIVNDAFVRRFFPGRNLVGVPLALTYRGALLGDVPMGTKTVVGIAADAVYRSIRTPMRPTIYVPMAQETGPILNVFFFIAVRSAGGPPALLTRRLASALRTVNGDLTMTFRPFTTLVDESLAQDRLLATLSGFFGALALLLAALGVYGVTAGAVALRHREIGIRMALGARRSSVVRLVLSRVTGLIGIGVIIGATVALWTMQFVSSLLYGLQPRDPVTLVAAILILAGIGVAAGAVPAWRASAMDPADVLRES